MSMVARDMEQSAFAYHFAPLRQDLNLADHEKIPLVLLSFKSRGAPRGNGTIGLNIALLNPAFTIEDLYLNKSLFSPSAAFEDGCFIIYLGELSLQF